MKIGEKIAGDFGTYTVVATVDGSLTLHSEEEKEACHSLDGAVGEALYNFVEGCRIREKSREKGRVAILEIGFGLGINFLETCRAMNGADFEYVALERDRKMVEAVFSSKSEKLLLTAKAEIEFGDAVETIDRLIGSGKKFDAFYQDPFSPKKNPRLWSVDWFVKLRHLAADGAILSTYSAARPVVEALTAASWKVTTRKGFGRKRESTLATPAEFILTRKE